MSAVAPSPLLSPPQDKDDFFFQEQEPEPVIKRQRKKPRLDSDDTHPPETQMSKTKRKPRKKLLLDNQIELTNTEMRSMIESGNTSSTNSWIEQRRNVCHLKPYLKSSRFVLICNLFQKREDERKEKGSHF